MSAVVISLDALRLRRAKAEHDEGARLLAAREAARARREGRVPVTRVEVERIIATLCASLGELEILRERLALQEGKNQT